LPAEKRSRRGQKSKLHQSVGSALAPLHGGQRAVYAALMSESRIKELLERREAIAREIARHPRPITGCDVHFNRLLEERAALSEEIDRLEALQAARTKPTISSP
jgi:hypothetical protein